MKTIITHFVLLFLLFGYSLSSFTQISAKQKRERKKMIRECSQSKNPYIKLDQFRVLSVDEFLNYSDSIYEIIQVKGTTSITNHQNKNIAVDGALLVFTPQYHDRMDLESRKSSIQEYRLNEIRTFFGEDSPLILMGDREISRKEYCELPEDTVAFVNFYMTNFVRRNYAPRGKNGIVYVCPRNTRSPIRYNPGMTLPANGRNYINDFYKDMFPCFTGGNKLSHLSDIHEKAKEYSGQVGKDVKATVIISCVVRPNGTIDPILVEEVQSQQQLTDAQTESLVKAAEEIIRTMPRWEIAGGGVIYDKRNKEFIADQREYSVSIPITFTGN